MDSSLLLDTPVHICVILRVLSRLSLIFLWKQLQELKQRAGIPPNPIRVSTSENRFNTTRTRTYKPQQNLQPKAEGSELMSTFGEVSADFYWGDVVHMPAIDNQGFVCFFPFCSSDKKSL